eukprot:COSAG02_NODE_5529_length_4252_cov_7.756080_1_plen_149_part_10
MYSMALYPDTIAALSRIGTSPKRTFLIDIVLSPDLAVTFSISVMLLGVGGNATFHTVPLTLAGRERRPNCRETLALGEQKPHTIALEGAACNTMPSPKMEANRNVAGGGRGVGDGDGETYQVLRARAIKYKMYIVYGTRENATESEAVY